MGYIYKISNDINSKIYIGQTSRDPQVRFHEHCFDTRSNSKLHEAIVELGYQHFKYDVIEECDVAKLDEREAYWVKQYDSYTNGYNSTFNGWFGNYSTKSPAILIEGPNLVFESRTEFAKQLSKITQWSEKFIFDKITDCIENEKLFLDTYKVYYTDCAEFSSIDETEDWMKTLNVRFCGKKIRLIELNKDFDTISSAAVWLMQNNYFTGYSKTPLQSLITSISGALKDGNSVVTANNFHFEELPGTTKNESGYEINFMEVPIYCDQLKVEFPSCISAAKYFVDHKLWGKIKVKTAKCRIADILRGYFREYRGYTFKYKKDGNWVIPEMLMVQLPYMDRTVPVDWEASEEE